jgi:soluble lytic murein transglycosylase-like protein
VTWVPAPEGPSWSAIWRLVFAAACLAGLALLLTLWLTPAHAQEQDPEPAPPPTVAEIVWERAEAWGVSPSLMLAVARCEAPGLNPYAVGRAGELGLYQLHPRGMLPVYWTLGYTDVWDPWQQADFAARMFAAGRAPAWSCYRLIAWGRV